MKAQGSCYFGKLRSSGSAVLLAAVAAGPVIAAPLSLPVTTDVNVLNIPDVNVSNVATVTVDNVPTVAVGNTISAPLPVQVVSGEPLDIAYDLSGSCNDPAKVYTVPAGKRLVIEHVSVFVRLNAGNAAEGNITMTPTSGPYRNAYLKLASQLANGVYSDYVADQPALNFADAGATVGLCVTADQVFPSGNYYAFVHVTGYLVGAP